MGRGTEGSGRGEKGEDRQTSHRPWDSEGSSLASPNTDSGDTFEKHRYCTCSFPTSHDSGLPDFVNAISPACTGSVINLSKPSLGHHPPSSLWQPQAPGLMPSSLCQPQWKWSQSQVSWMSLCLSFSRRLNSPGGHAFSLSPLHPSPSSGPDIWP